VLADFEERNKGFKENNPEGYVKSLEKFKNKQTLDTNKRVN